MKCSLRNFGAIVLLSIFLMGHTAHAGGGGNTPPKRMSLTRMLLRYVPVQKLAGKVAIELALQKWASEVWTRGEGGYDKNQRRIKSKLHYNAYAATFDFLWTKYRRAVRHQVFYRDGRDVEITTGDVFAFYNKFRAVASNPQRLQHHYCMMRDFTVTRLKHYNLQHAALHVLAQLKPWWYYSTYPNGLSGIMAGWISLFKAIWSGPSHRARYRYARRKKFEAYKNRYLCKGGSKVERKELARKKRTCVTQAESEVFMFVWRRLDDVANNEHYGQIRDLYYRMITDMQIRLQGKRPKADMCARGKLDYDPETGNKSQGALRFEKPATQKAKASK